MVLDRHRLINRIGLTALIFGVIFINKKFFIMHTKPKIQAINPNRFEFSPRTHYSFGWSVEKHNQIELRLEITTASGESRKVHFTELVPGPPRLLDCDDGTQLLQYLHDHVHVEYEYNPNNPTEIIFHLSLKTKLGNKSLERTLVPLMLFQKDKDYRGVHIHP
jgi:hypothetical protein